MTKEIWRDLPGYDGRYRVSNLGNIFSSHLKRCLIPASASGGRPYLAVSLTNRYGTRTRRVHHLVLESFVGPRPAGFHASHLDGNARNNKAENLKWESPRDNNKRKHQHNTQPIGERLVNARLTAEGVIYARRRHKEGASYSALGRELNVCHATIRSAVLRKTWTHIADPSPTPADGGVK